MATIQLTNTLPTSQRPGNFYIPWTSQRNQSIATPFTVGIVGVFARGLVDSPQYVAQPTAGIAYSAFREFGVPTPHPTTAGKNLNGQMSLLNVAAQNVINKAVVRVGSTQLRTGYVTLTDAASNSVLSLHAASPGTWSNGTLSYATSVGSLGGSYWTLTVTDGTTGESKTYANLPGGSAANIALAIATINADNSWIIRASLPVIDGPTAAPTVTASGTDGSLANVPHYIQVAYTTAAGGETPPSPEQTVTPSATNHLAVSVVSLPTGTNGIKVYIATKKGGEQFAVSAAANSVNVLALPSATAALPMYGLVAPNIPAPSRTPATSAGATSTWVVNATAATFPASSPAAGQGIGNDGADPPTSRYSGWQGSPSVGAATFLAMASPPDFVVYAEEASADTTEWLTQAQNAQKGGWLAVMSCAEGTSAAAAPAVVTGQLSALGVYADFVKVAWNWGQVLDPAGSGAQMLTAPAPLFAAITAQQSWERAAFNKPVLGLTGLEFSATPDQLEAMVPANVNSLIAGIPAGATLYGFDNDRMASGLDAFEMRARAYFSRLIGTATGPFVGNINSDVVRQQVHDTITGIFDTEARLGRLPSNPSTATTTGAATSATPTTQTGRGTANPGTPPIQSQTTGNTSTTAPLAYAVICDTSNNINPGTGQAAPILYITVMAAIFSNIRQIWTQSQIGQQVVVNLTPLPLS